MCAALPNVARLWRCVALPQTHGIPRDHKGRYSVHGARPVTPPDSQPCCHRAIAAAVNTQNTNASYCAFKLDTRPSRPNESFVTPLFCWLSRSLTGTLFWQIGYTPFFFCCYLTVIDTLDVLLTALSSLNLELRKLLCLFQRCFFCIWPKICFHLRWFSSIIPKHWQSSLAAWSVAVSGGLSALYSWSLILSFHSGNQCVMWQQLEHSWK